MKRRMSCALALVLAGSGAAAQDARPPLSDAQASARVEALLARMTLDEKIGQLTQVAGALIPGADPAAALRRGSAGSVLWLNDTKTFNELQRVAVEESRLKIPALFADLWAGGDSRATLQAELAVTE